MVDADEFEKRTGRSRLVLTISAALFVAVLVLGGSIVFLVDRESGLVILKADPDPYKVRPSDPGGKKLDNLDSPVLGLLDPLDEKETGREVLTPPESAPEPPPISVEEDSAATSGEAAPGAGDEADPASAPDPEEEPQAGEEAPAPEPAKDDEKDVAVASADGSGEQSDAGNAAPEDSGASGGEIDNAIAQIDDAPEATGASPDGTYFVVQFAAFKSEKNATDTAALLASKHASRLNGISIGYLQRGDFWRVVTDPLPRTDASEMCAMFRSVGQDCIVKLMEPDQ